MRGPCNDRVFVQPLNQKADCRRSVMARRLLGGSGEEAFRRRRDVRITVAFVVADHRHHYTERADGLDDWRGHGSVDRRYCSPLLPRLSSPRLRDDIQRALVVRDHRLEHHFAETSARPFYLDWFRSPDFGGLNNPARKTPIDVAFSVQKAEIT